MIKHTRLFFTGSAGTGNRRDLLRTLCLGAIALGLLLRTDTSVAWAGMNGQPAPSQEMVARLRGAVRQFVITGGDLGKARPDLILIIEKEPTADFTDYVTPALTDSIAYQGMVDTLIEKLGEETERSRQYYIQYNIARLHLLRGQTFINSRQARPFLDAAARTIAQIPTSLRDNAVSELRGDIEMERGDTKAAMAAYQQMSGGNSTALSQYKMGLAYLKVSRYREAEAALSNAVRADAQSVQGQGQLYHYIWQALGTLYIAQRRESDAVAALNRSLKIKASEAGTFRFRTGLARTLLSMGYRKPVAEYAAAALKLTPDDPELTVLLGDAGGEGRR